MCCKEKRESNTEKNRRVYRRFFVLQICPPKNENSAGSGAMTEMTKGGDTAYAQTAFSRRSDGSQTGINPPAQPSAPFPSSPQFHLEPTPFPKRGKGLNRSVSGNAR